MTVKIKHTVFPIGGIIIVSAPIQEGIFYGNRNGRECDLRQLGTAVKHIVSAKIANHIGENNGSEFRTPHKHAVSKRNNIAKIYAAQTDTIFKSTFA